MSQPHFPFKIKPTLGSVYFHRITKGVYAGIGIFSKTPSMREFVEIKRIQLTSHVKQLSRAIENSQQTFVLETWNKGGVTKTNI